MITSTVTPPIRYSRWLPNEYASVGRPVPVVTYRGVKIGLIRPGFSQVNLEGVYWGGFLTLDFAKSFIDEAKKQTV